MPRPAKSARTVVPIILAAGPPRGLGFPKALAPFQSKTALKRAVETCRATRGLGRPVVVLGCDAKRVLKAWQKLPSEQTAGVMVTLNRRWRKGQLGSLLAGLKRVPRRAAGFVIYPVDYPLLTPRLLVRLLAGFARRKAWHKIVAPAIGRRTGHPIVIARELTSEIRTCARRGGTAREVIYRTTQPDRVRRIAVGDTAIFRDFDSPASYRICVRMLNARARLRRAPTRETSTGSKSRREGRRGR